MSNRVSYGNLHPDQTPPVGEVRRITVGFDRNQYIQQAGALNPKYPGDISPTIARVLTKDPVVAVKHKNGLGGGIMHQSHEMPKGLSVLNKFGDARDSKHTIVSMLTFLGLCTKQMQTESLESNTGQYSAVDIQGHTWAWNRSPEPVRIGDQVMWDIPDSVEEAEYINRVAGPPTQGAYPEKRYTTFLRAYKPELVHASARADWQNYLNGGAPDFSTTPDAMAAIRQLVAIGMLIGGVLFPSDIRGTERASPLDFIGIVKVAMSMMDDPQVAMPDVIDAEYQGLLNNLVRQLRNGDLDAYIGTLLTPLPEHRVVEGKRVAPGTTEELRYINEIQKTGVPRTLNAVDQVFSEAGRDRIIGRALDSAKPGENFGLIMYGK